MIKHLHVRNYALIESLEIDFSKGLTIITGETGAGKSILLGALGLIMGKRADTKALYHQERKCVVEALFDISRYGLLEFFRTHDLDYEAELVVRRELLPSGKSRAFINDTPVNLRILQDLSSSLVDLHQQFDTLDIHQVSFQLRMLDALAGNKDLLAHYEVRYRKYQAARQTLADLIDRNQNAAKESEFITFQLQEFKEAELRAGEQEQLEEELSLLSNAEEIKQVLSTVHQHLNDTDQALTGQLKALLQSLGQIRRYDGGIEAIYDRFDSLLVELDDLVREITGVAETTEYDPERIAEIQDRVNLIYRLENKHNVSNVEALLELQHNLQSQLNAFNDLSNDIQALEKNIQQQQRELFVLAGELTQRRRAVVSDFETKVSDMLNQLAMEHARLEVNIKAVSEPGPTGIDEVNFFFAANKGSRLQLIKDVASGGELSRLTLVTKSLVASAIPLPTLIFDEIDTGVSGDVALKMGNILRRLSNHHQVVSITHSPQIASKAERHYFVYKKIKSERTVTEVRLLDGEDRIRAIATMLSQSPPSASAMENARELLSQSF